MSSLLAPFRWTADFLSRHKRKIAIGTAVGVVAGGVYVYRRAKPLMYVSRHTLWFMQCGRDNFREQMKMMEQQAEASANLQ